ncbi:PrgH/EprH family type III secretion apparatus protein [Escherichia coli]|nr:PrgH/EprH family type III secretion apparatus protein [Escherichia coli]
MPAKTQTQYTMKVLFGPMFGCELHLPADDYFLIIAPGLALKDNVTTSLSAMDHAATYTQKTLYIPCETPSPNLILHLLEQADKDGIGVGYHIEIQDESNSHPVALRENEVFTYQHIRFAIKRNEDEWSEHIKNFTLPSVHDDEFSSQKMHESLKNKRHQTLIICTIILIMSLLTASVIWYRKLEHEQQLFNLNEVIGSAPFPLEIVRGHNDKFIYVLAKEYQAMEWVQEALFKRQENKTVVPVWLPKQKKEIIEQLSKAGFPVLQIDFTKPQHPIIALWQDLSTQEIEDLNVAALQQIPFALDIRTTIKTKVQLLQDARQGLDRLHIYYRQINTPTGYALVVRDALSDSALSALLYFIKNFNHQWGNRIINFSVNLDENWLQNKSYLDSSNGYLFLNPHHWYFPLKQGDANA